MSSPLPSTTTTTSSPDSAGIERTNSRRPNWSVLAGWMLSGVVVLFNLIDGLTKMAHADLAVDGAATLGFPDKYLFGIGLTLVICSVLSVIPFTSLIGAVLLTGYLGGAVAIQLRVESLNFLFALALGILVWVGLLLRDARLRTFLRETIIG